MKILITTGPSYEPVDEVRRVTNFSTGELGVCLAHCLHQEGHAVTLLRGEASTFPCDFVDGPVIPFSTNRDLIETFEGLARSGGVGAIFHAAALCDFEVVEISDSAGTALQGAKLSTRHGELLLRLRPTAKVIGHLRAMFPQARLIGWKYEMSGTRAEVVAKGLLQISENHTDACVVNGRAFGPGFGLLRPDGSVEPADSKPDLCRKLSKFCET